MQKSAPQAPLREEATRGNGCELTMAVIHQQNSKNNWRQDTNPAPFLFRAFSALLGGLTLAQL